MPLIPMILVLEDRYQFSPFIDTKNVLLTFFITLESRKTGVYGISLKITFYGATSRKMNLSTSIDWPFFTSVVSYMQNSFVTVAMLSCFGKGILQVPDTNMSIGQY